MSFFSTKQIITLIMENTASWISIVADICGILGFFISIFAVCKVYIIKKQIKDSNKIYVKGTTVSGDFVGRDKNTN